MTQQRLWLANVEDAFSPRSVDDDAVLLPRVASMAPRFLLHAAPGDAVVVSCPVPGEWVSIVSSILGCQRRLQVFVAPVPARSVPDRPYSLIDTIADDTALFDRLHQLVRKGAWRLEPYYQSARVTALAARLGIPGNLTPEKIVAGGWVDLANDKLCFKDLAREHKVPVVPGLDGSSLGSIAAAIDQCHHDQPGPLMLRKTMSGGGIGNLTGPIYELQFLLPDWYRAGEVVVEPFLGLAQTLGSLVEIHDDALIFRGVDEQVIEECCWAGFRYPCDDTAVVAPVREYSLRLAAAVCSQGLRGLLNLDWGVTRDETGRPTILALESNFRHNGMSHILDFAARYFGAAHAAQLAMLFVDNVRVDDTLTTVGPWLDRLRRFKVDGKSMLIERVGNKYGVLPVLPPNNGRCGVAIFGPDHATVASWHQQLKRVLDF